MMRVRPVTPILIVMVRVNEWESKESLSRVIIAMFKEINDSIDDQKRKSRGDI